MKKLILWTLLIAALAGAPTAHAQKTKAQITTEINSFFADNTTGQITPAKLRTVTTDIVNSYVDWLTCTGSGGLVYWSAGVPTCITAGTAGQVLQTNGTFSPPSWVNSSASNGCTRMQPKSNLVGDWTVIDAYGNVISTAGSTTNGLQEAINFSINNGQCLQIFGQGTLALGAQTGTTTNGSAIITGLATTAALLAGDWVVASAGGIPAFTRILSVDSPTQIHINNNATLSGARTLTFTRGAGANRATYLGAASTVVIPPVEQWTLHAYNVNLTCSPAVNGPCVQFDSAIIMDFNWMGQIVYQPSAPTVNSVAILIAPTNPVPLDGITAFASNRVYISNLASPSPGTAEAVIAFNVSVGSVTNNLISSVELNGTGTGATANTNIGLKVFGPSASTSFEQNIIDITDIHLVLSAALQLGVNTTNAGNIRHNVWRIGGIRPAGASAAGISSFGSYDLFEIGSITNEEGTVLQGINLQSSAVGNKINYGQIVGAGTALLDSGTCNSWNGANGTKIAILGTTSGCTTLQSAAAASGTITWPAGTTNFPATGGAGQVVKQTSVGGAFTVAAVAATELSGVLPVASGGTNCSAASGTCLDNITGFGSNGFVARTGAGTYAARTLTGTANEITVTNGDGVSGNPTFSLPAALTFTGKTVTGGTINSATLGATTLAGTISGGGNQINNVIVGTSTPLAGFFTNLTLSGSSAPANGVYLPTTNTLGFAVNSLDALRLRPVASSVNYAYVTGAATGGGGNRVTYGADGTDTDVSIDFIAKGAGNVNFNGQGSNAGAIARFQTFGAGNANGVLLTSAASGSGPTISSQDLGGTGNATIDLNLAAVGTAGKVAVNNDIKTGTVAVGSLPTCNAGRKGAHYFVTDSNAASYTAGIGAIVAAGGATNVPVVCDGTNWRIG